MPNKTAKSNKRKRIAKNSWLKKHGRTANQYKRNKIKEKGKGIVNVPIWSN